MNPFGTDLPFFNHHSQVDPEAGGKHRHQVRRRQSQHEPRPWRRTPPRRRPPIRRALSAIQAHAVAVALSVGNLSSIRRRKQGAGLASLPVRTLLSAFIGIVLAIAAPSALATETPDAGARLLTRRGTAAGEPPWWRDEFHVPNGCHLSSLRYVARFSAAYPTERATVFVLGSGRARRHTIALVTWSGHWWARDEYLGVLPIGIPAARDTTTHDFSRRVHKAHKKHQQSVRGRWVFLSSPPARSNPSYEKRLADVHRAARIVPRPTRIYSVIGRGTRVPLLAFTPEPGWIAVYDPSRGTALLECGRLDIAKSVHLIARQLGYLGDAIKYHPADPVDASSVIATAGP